MINVFVYLLRTLIFPFPHISVSFQVSLKENVQYLVLWELSNLSACIGQNHIQTHHAHKIANIETRFCSKFLVSLQSLWAGKQSTLLSGVEKQNFRPLLFWYVMNHFRYISWDRTGTSLNRSTENKLHFTFHLIQSHPLKCHIQSETTYR